MSEQLVQDVVKEVVAKLQINADVSGSKGVFADMDTAIEAAKQAQKKVRTMSMDQREKIISIIRRKKMRKSWRGWAFRKPAWEM